MKRFLLYGSVLFLICSCRIDYDNKSIPDMFNPPIQDSLESFVLSVGLMPTLEGYEQVFSIIISLEDKDTIIRLLGGLSLIDGREGARGNHLSFSGLSQINGQFIFVSCYDLPANHYIIDTCMFSYPKDSINLWQNRIIKDECFQRFPSWRKYKYSSQSMQLIDYRVGNYEIYREQYYYWDSLEKTDILSVRELNHMFSVISGFDEKTDSFFLYKANDMVFKYLYNNPHQFINALRLLSPTTRNSIYEIIQEGPVKVAYQGYPKLILSKLENTTKRSAIKDSIIHSIHQYIVTRIQ